MSQKALRGKELLNWWKNVKGVTLSTPTKHTRDDGSVYWMMKVYGGLETTVYLEDLEGEAVK